MIRIDGVLNYQIRAFAEDTETIKTIWQSRFISEGLNAKN